MNKRRYLCPGCNKELIFKKYPKRTFSYHKTVNRCRKCAKKARLLETRKDENIRKAARREQYVAS